MGNMNTEGKNKVRTGIKGLDEMLFDGFVPGSANLIEGAPGTGKTTLAMEYVYNGIVEYGEPGLIITFEEFPQQYYHDALQLGWDLKKLESENKLKVIFSDPSTALKEIGDMDGKIVGLIEDMGIKRVAVDSMTHFESLAMERDELRSLEKDFINALKREGTTSVLLRENDSLLGQMSHVTSKIPFVADTYILLRYVEIESVIRKALVILKMRGSNHFREIHRYEIGSSGIEVESKFAGMSGIMSGFTQPTPQDAFVKAFGKG